MSTTPQPPNALEAPPAGKNNNRRIDEAFEDVARLAGSDVSPADFYQQFLAKVVAGIESPAGAVWLRTPQGFLRPPVPDEPGRRGAGQT